MLSTHIVTTQDGSNVLRAVMSIINYLCQESISNNVQLDYEQQSFNFSMFPSISESF